MAVALYARVSTTRQADNDLSIPDQLNQMRDWCAKQGYTIANEYIELGASATDDKRPEFQKMMADATLSPSPFEAIIIHSLSRFYRDMISFGLYERKLTKSSVKLISITQPTSNDPSGEMARKLFSLFDEYQSKENSKHTIRAMKENARQGYFNGARAPFGYKTIETDQHGSKGRKKKKLAVEQIESAVVKQIYQLYLNGHHGNTMGMKAISTLLNKQGYTMRGKLWRTQKINEILADSTYSGDHYFNRYEGKTKKRKPREEWILVPVEPIIEKALFTLAEAKRTANQPKNSNPKQNASPIFLSGLIKCGQCGSGMTLVTGKSGRYRYYKCTNQKHKTLAACNTSNIPMEKLDQKVRERLSERVFNPRRVRNIMTRLRKQINAQDQGDKALKIELKQQLSETNLGLERLMQSIEAGIFDFEDETLRTRVQRLKARKEEYLIQLSGIQRRQNLLPQTINNSQIDAFCQALKNRFNDPESGFGKGYLKFLVDEVRIEKDKAIMKGSNQALAEFVSALNPENSAVSVPTSISKWRAGEDSNPRPSGS